MACSTDRMRSLELYFSIWWLVTNGVLFFLSISCSSGAWCFEVHLGFTTLGSYWADLIIWHVCYGPVSSSLFSRRLAVRCILPWHNPVRDHHRPPAAAERRGVAYSEIGQGQQAHGSAGWSLSDPERNDAREFGFWCDCPCFVVRFTVGVYTSAHLPFFGALP